MDRPVLFEHHHHHNYASAPAQQQQQTGISFATGAIALVVLVFVACPHLFDTVHPLAKIERILHAIQDMASGLRLGLLKRPLPVVANVGAEGSALNTVFGLKGNALKTLGSDTIQRGVGGIRSLVKGFSSDVPPGLGNWDNSCYQNSVIQGFASVQCLPSFLARVSSKGATPGSTNAALLDIVEKLNDSTNNGQQLWLPSTLKSMSTWQQQDAQEYFSKILDQLDKEAIKAARTTSGARYNLSSEEAGETRLASADSVEMPKEASVHLQNPLEGMLAQRVGCLSCGYSEGLSLIPFNCLTVPLGHDYMYDIRDCLDEYTKLEEIEGVQCPKCTLLQTQGRLRQILERGGSEQLTQSARKQLSLVTEALEGEDFSDNTLVKKCQMPKQDWATSTKTKQAVIARAPNTLVIHVNRSIFNEITGAQTKNTAAVRFPLTFGLDDWSIGKTASIDDAIAEAWPMDPAQSMLPDHAETFQSEDSATLSSQYELRAVVTHFGRHENGHYVCYRRHSFASTSEAEGEGESWWRLSDDDVTRVKEEFVLQQGGVFMIFYERMDEATLNSKSALPKRGVKTSSAAMEKLALATQVPLPDDELDFDMAIQVPLPDDELDFDTAIHDLAEAAGVPLPDEDEDEAYGTSEAAPVTEETSRQDEASLSGDVLTPVESVSESDFEEHRDDPDVVGYSSRPTQAIHMRTSSVFSPTEGALESPRMVTA